MNIQDYRNHSVNFDILDLLWIDGKSNNAIGTANIQINFLEIKNIKKYNTDTISRQMFSIGGGLWKTTLSQTSLQHLVGVVGGCLWTKKILMYFII